MNLNVQIKHLISQYLNYDNLFKINQIDRDYILILSKSEFYNKYIEPNNIIFNITYQIYKESDDDSTDHDYIKCWSKEKPERMIALLNRIIKQHCYIIDSSYIHSNIIQRASYYDKKRYDRRFSTKNIIRFLVYYSLLQ